MKYIDADRLRKAVEKKYNSNDTVGDRWDLGYDTACEQILEIIDSLQQEQPEQPIRGYDEAYLNEKIAKATKSWKGVDVDKFMDEMRGREPEVDLEKLQSSPLSNLDEAAIKYGHEEPILPEGYNDGDIPLYERWTAEVFKAGAEWQKKQDKEAIKTAEDHAFLAGADWQKDQFEKNRLAHCDKLTKEEYDRETDFALGIIEGEYRQPTFTDAINYGMQVMKGYLMKEAVEGFFTKSIDGDTVFAESTALDVDPKSVKAGDKVKLIVIKED